MLEIVSVSSQPTMVGYPGDEHVHELALTLGMNLRRARGRLKLTLEEVATSVGLTAQEYERIERGNFPPSVQVFLDLCVTLGVPADELLEPGGPRLRFVRAGLMDTTWKN